MLCSLGNLSATCRSIDFGTLRVTTEFGPKLAAEFIQCCRIHRNFARRQQGYPGYFLQGPLGFRIKCPDAFYLGVK